MISSPGMRACCLRPSRSREPGEVAFRMFFESGAMGIRCGLWKMSQGQVKRLLTFELKGCHFPLCHGETVDRPGLEVGRGGRTR